MVFKMEIRELGVRSVTEFVSSTCKDTCTCKVLSSVPSMKKRGSQRNEDLGTYAISDNSRS